MDGNTPEKMFGIKTFRIFKAKSSRVDDFNLAKRFSDVHII